MKRLLIALALYLGLLPCFAQDVSVYPLGVMASPYGALPSMGGGRAPSTIFVSGAAQTISSTSDTSCFSPTGSPPGQTITPGNGAPYVYNSFQLVCEGVYSTPLVNTVGITAKVKWGSTTVTSITSSGLQANATNLQWTLQARCTLWAVSTTPGASTVMCWGTFSYAQSATGSQPVMAYFQSLSPVSVDTTAPFKVDMTMAWASTVTTQTATAVGSSVRILY